VRFCRNGSGGVEMERTAQVWALGREQPSWREVGVVIRQSG
jgi:hypothetical protein